MKDQNTNGHGISRKVGTYVSSWVQTDAGTATSMHNVQRYDVIDFSTYPTEQKHDRVKNVSKQGFDCKKTKERQRVRK